MRAHTACRAGRTIGDAPHSEPMQRDIASTAAAVLVVCKRYLVADVFDSSDELILELHSVMN